MAKPSADRPREDQGLFGPDSPTWRVWTHAAGFVGFQRAVTIQSLDPNLSTAVAHVPMRLCNVTIATAPPLATRLPPWHL